MRCFFSTRENVSEAERGMKTCGEEQLLLRISSDCFLDAGDDPYNKNHSL
jgi:hypothetical protein